MFETIWTNASPPSPRICATRSTRGVRLTRSGPCSAVSAIHVHGAVPRTIPATSAPGRQSESARLRAETATASTHSGTAASVVASTAPQRSSSAAIRSAVIGSAGSARGQRA